MRQCNVAGTALLVVLSVLSVALRPAAVQAASGGTYYTERPVFIPYPQPDKKWSIKNYGPVGIGIDLVPPMFTMRITNVEQGSPAYEAGTLAKGQIIESINGQVIQDRDPRVLLADIITAAEATDGRMVFQIKDVGPVTVEIPVLGRYSDTWPLHCPKSDRIVRNFADRAAALEKPDWTAALFLLSTGEEKDLATVRRWVDEAIPTWKYPWYVGYRGVALCEYYLRTGDERVMPAINEMSATLKGSMYEGSWMGRGSVTPNFKYMGGGHMNAAGVHALNFLLLAKQCGAEVDDYLLQRVLKQFFRYAGRGNVAYGDQLPEGGFRDNGKTAGLAVAMSSAAALDPEGEDSIYAAARDNSAMKSFYATTWFNRAHTGGGIGEIWHGVAMQLMVDTKPRQYRSFMEERRWFYELSRRHDGSFGIADGGRYDKTIWGNYFALAYTAPRKKLRMFGAPPTPHSKVYPLPERPWGNAADDRYQSILPALHKPGERLDISKEIIRTHASGPLMSTMGADASDVVFWVYAHHPEYAVRSAVAKKIVRQDRTYMIVPLLKSEDPRVREVGVLTMAGMFKGRPIGVGQITDEMYALMAAMLQDPQEAHWVKMQVMQALGRLPPEKIVPLTDDLLTYLQMDDWWMQGSALHPLTQIATHEKVYQKVLPVIAAVAVTNTAPNLLGSARNLPKQLARAKSDVREFAVPLFVESYLALPDQRLAPGGADLASGLRQTRRTLLSWVMALPGGRDALVKIPRFTSAWQTSRWDADKYVHRGFVANPPVIGTWETVHVVESVDDFRKILVAEAAEARKRNAKPDGKKRAPRFGIPDLHLEQGGKVVSPRNYVWSGDMLLSLSNEQALRMGPVMVDGQEYLFVEVGGFSDAHERDWETRYYVMARKE